jgi:hypothetical protein
MSAYFHEKLMGCSREQWLELVELGVARRYTQHKYGAKTRGIGFHLNLWEWWTIWRDSGKWAERGGAKGCYVMCRKGDSGPYAVGNVYIATTEHNSSMIWPNLVSRSDVRPTRRRPVRPEGGIHDLIDRRDAPATEQPA